MSAIHESTKVLYEDLLLRYRDTLLTEGDGERAQRYAKILVEVTLNTIDDNANLLAQLKKLEQSTLAAGEPRP